MINLNTVWRIFIFNLKWMKVKFATADLTISNYKVKNLIFLQKSSVEIKLIS